MLFTEIFLTSKNKISKSFFLQTEVSPDSDPTLCLTLLNLFIIHRLHFNQRLKNRKILPSIYILQKHILYNFLLLSHIFNIFDFSIRSTFPQLFQCNNLFHSDLPPSSHFLSHGRSNHPRNKLFLLNETDKISRIPYKFIKSLQIQTR